MENKLTVFVIPLKIKLDKIVQLHYFLLISQGEGLLYPELRVKWSAVNSTSPLPLSIFSAMAGKDPGNTVPFLGHT